MYLLWYSYEVYERTSLGNASKASLNAYACIVHVTTLQDNFSYLKVYMYVQYMYA